jgi:hypothetical protein
LELLRLFEAVTVPFSVEAEVKSVVLPAWIRRASVAPHSLVIPSDVHRGEADAIALAVELKVGAALLDDSRARRWARELGLRVVGRLGLLLEAKRHGKLLRIRPLIDELRAHDFFVAPVICNRVLQDAGELES